MLRTLSYTKSLGWVIGRGNRNRSPSVAWRDGEGRQAPPLIAAPGGVPEGFLPCLPCPPDVDLRWSGVGRQGREAVGENSPPPQRAPTAEEPSKDATQGGGSGAPGTLLLRGSWKALQRDGTAARRERRDHLPAPGVVSSSRPCVTRVGLCGSAPRTGPTRLPKGAPGAFPAVVVCESHTPHAQVSDPHTPV